MDVPQTNLRMELSEHEKGKMRVTFSFIFNGLSATENDSTPGALALIDNNQCSGRAPRRLHGCRRHIVFNNTQGAHPCAAQTLIESEFS